MEGGAHRRARLPGVRGIANEVEVRSRTERSDTGVAQSAVNALKWNVMVPSDDVTVKVENGSLTLRGEVRWDYERRAAERTVRNLPGVKGITNALVVRPRVEPKDVKEKIRNYLQARSDLQRKPHHRAGVWKNGYPPRQRSLMGGTSRSGERRLGCAGRFRRYQPHHCRAGGGCGISGDGHLRPPDPLRSLRRRLISRARHASNRRGYKATSPIGGHSRWTTGTCGDKPNEGASR